jgi:hypothetical protein
MPFLLEKDVNVEVTQTDKGVTIALTSENPETVAKLKAEVPERINWARKLGKVVADRPKGLKAPGAPEPFELQVLASDKVHVDVAQLDNGVAVNIASDDPALAGKIKADLPRRIEVGRRLAQQFGEMQATALQQPRFDEAREMLKHLASGDIKIDLADRDNGLVVTVTSTNPETVKKLQERAHQGMRKLAELREKAARGELPLGPQGLAPGQPSRQPGPGRQAFGPQRGLREGETGRQGFSPERRGFGPGEPGRPEFGPEDRGYGPGEPGGQKFALENPRYRLRERGEQGPGESGVRRRPIDPELRKLIRQEIRRYLKEEGKEEDED